MRRKIPMTLMTALLSVVAFAAGDWSGKVVDENGEPIPFVNVVALSNVIGGFYKGGNVPEGMSLYPIRSGRWLKVHFVGGMAAFQQQFAEFHKEWLPAHPEFKWSEDIPSIWDFISARYTN